MTLRRSRNKVIKFSDADPGSFQVRATHSTLPKPILYPHLSRDMATHPRENARENARELSSLTQWSQEHVRAIFESSSNDEFIQAIEETFSSDLKAMVNGKRVGRQEIKQSVLSMRTESSGGLRVEWKQTVEVPQDTYNRVIFFESIPVQFLTSFSPIERIIRRFLCHSQHQTKPEARGRRS